MNLGSRTSRRDWQARRPIEIRLRPEVSWWADRLPSVAIDPPNRARVDLPSWLWGGDPKRLLAESELRSRSDGPNGYFVQTEESYRRQRPDLVRLRPIVKPTETLRRWEHLEHAEERVAVTIPERLETDLERRRLKAEERGALVDLFNHQVLLLHSLPLKDLREQSEYFLGTLNDIQFDEDPTRGPFRHTGLHLVQINPTVLHRLKLASVLLRIEQDPVLHRGDQHYLQTLGTKAGDLFSSSAGLYDGVLMFDAYLAPLMAAGTPGIWGVNVVRSFGCMVFSLGTFVSGTESEAAELLHLVAVPGAKAPTKFTPLSPIASHGALEWWTDRLNELFGVLSDLSPFTDEQGGYRPAKHLEAMLTIEQIFRRTTSLLIAHRDTNARRTLLFTVLDSMEGVRGVSLLMMCTLTHANKVLESLEASLHAPAAEVLLPAARRGVSALRQMQAGFFIRSQLATDKVDLRLEGDETRSLSPEAAAARYLKVLRDATHGHGSDKETSKAQTAALLAHHNGDVPHDLGLLGYLYLLDLIAHPDRLRRTLFRGGR